MLDAKVFSSAVKEAILFCLEKQTAKSPTTDEYDVIYLCPICNSPLYLEQKYCDRCGQHIKWDD